MTHDDHDTTLAAIEARLMACGTPMEDVDTRVAEVLGVPVDYYFAYRLVVGAIEAHHRRPGADDPCSPDEAAAALTKAQVLADSLATVVAATYRAATGSGTTREVAAHAARLTSLRLALSKQLRRAAVLAVPFEQPPLPFTTPDDEEGPNPDGCVEEPVAAAAAMGRGR